MSRDEQAGVDRDDDDLRARLADGNARYEQRFDRIYLVRAAGRTAAEMLDLLEQRLLHDPATEAEVTRGQLAEIAHLRLRGLLTDDPGDHAGTRGRMRHDHAEHPRPGRRPRPARRRARRRAARARRA